MDGQSIFIFLKGKQVLYLPFMKCRKNYSKKKSKSYCVDIKKYLSLRSPNEKATRGVA